MYVRRSVTLAAVAGALTLSACGASSGDQTGDAATQVATQDAETPAPPPDTAGAPVSSQTGSSTPAPPATASSVTAPPATSPVATAPAATAAAETSTSLPAPASAEVGGRAFAEMLATTSDIATNPLPDLVVDDVGRGSKINLRNIFPAERPVLIWMWAPH